MQGLPQIGEVLDDTYRIESLLGQGGFGAVYLARQLSMDRQVAIKVLVAHAMKVDEMTQRFRREVMAVRNLEHPNTIRIYDFRDNNSDGILYYSMEYVRGRTLKDIIDEGAVPEKRTVHIIRQVLKSLAEAHNHGIVHRDLKPANIMLADLYGEKDFVKVVDFGIAKIVDNSEENDESEPLTSAGVLVGTLRYMSPEQITGQGIGPHSDLYALGLIGVEMLAGQSVFEGSGRWDVLHKQISDDPVDIPEGVLATPLGQVFAKALEKDPEKRYSLAEEMLEAFDAAMAGGRPAPAANSSSDTSEAAFANTQATPVVAGPPADDDDEATMMAELPEGILPDPSGFGDAPTAPPSESAPRPNVSPMAAQFVAPSGNTDSIHMDDLDPGAGSSKGPLIAIALALFILVGLVGFIVYDSGETEDAVAAVDPTVEEPKQEEPKNDPEPEVKEEPPKEEVALTRKWIRVSTPGTQAKVFDNGVFVGNTPMRLEVSKPITYQLSADGYEPAEISLTTDSEDKIEVELKKEGKSSKKDQAVASADTKKKDEKKRDDKKRDDKKKDTKKTTKPKDKPKDTGWVDIKPTKKKDEKKKSDVPLF